jgi:hypothetical protein
MDAPEHKGTAAVDNLFNKVKAELMSWPGVTMHPHRFGGTEFRVNGKEMGHMHGSALVDLPFPVDIRNELVKSGKVEPHHIMPNSGWVSYWIGSNGDSTDQDFNHVVGLFHMQYERLGGKTKMKADLSA